MTRARTRTFHVSTPAGQYRVSVEALDGPMLMSEDRESDHDMEVEAAAEEIVIALLDRYTGWAGGPETAIVAREP